MKKILMSVVALGGLFAMALPVSAEEDVALWGDTNCTGDIDAADMMNVKRALIGLPLGPMANPCAEGFIPATTDLNCNGEMDAGDLVLIKRAAIGLPVETC